MIVVDASALLHALASKHLVGSRVRERIDTDIDHHAPQIVKAEVLSGLRRMALAGEVPQTRAVAISRLLADSRIETYPVEPFLTRIWHLRNHLSVYDAWYVAVAEGLDAPLVTTDVRLAKAPGIECEVDLIWQGSG